MNEQIRVPRVRLITETGEQLGVVATRDALERARSVGLDLMEVAPNENPPVCKIMDYGKYKYQLSKKAQEAKKKQTLIQIKEMKLGLKIEEHDFQFKMKHLRGFLEEGHKLKIIIMFRGREILHVEMGEKLAQKVIDSLKDVGELEQRSRFDGRNIVMIFAPL